MQFKWRKRVSMRTKYEKAKVKWLIKINLLFLLLFEEKKDLQSKQKRKRKSWYCLVKVEHRKFEFGQIGVSLWEWNLFVNEHMYVFGWACGRRRTRVGGSVGGRRRSGSYVRAIGKRAFESRMRCWCWRWCWKGKLIWKSIFCMKWIVMQS